MVSSVDAGLSMQNVITAAESLGLGIVPIGGIRKSPDEIIDLLQLPEYTYPIVGLSLGYPADNSAIKPRMPRESYRHDEVYNKEKMSAIIGKYDEDLSIHLKHIGREQEIDWSNQTMSAYQYVYFPKVYPSLRKQGFKNEK